MDDDITLTSFPYINPMSVFGNIYFRLIKARDGNRKPKKKNLHLRLRFRHIFCLLQAKTVVFWLALAFKRIAAYSPLHPFMKN